MNWISKLWEGLKALYYFGDYHGINNLESTTQKQAFEDATRVVLWVTILILIWSAGYFIHVCKVAIKERKKK